MRKKILITGILLLFIISLLSFLTMANNFDKSVIGVKAHVAAYQELNVLEPVMVNFDYPWPGAETGQALILNDVGKIQIKSNSDWNLNINNALDSDFKIYVKPSGGTISWQNIKNIAYISNIYGKYNISWDIKILPPFNIDKISTGKKQIQLSFMISQL